MFLMPSRFEPCGLNQMYSQRYGTPPIARATGGLVDSIVDATPADDRATAPRPASCSTTPPPTALWAAVRVRWRRLREARVSGAPSSARAWRSASAGRIAPREYVALYRTLLDDGRGRMTRVATARRARRTAAPVAPAHARAIRNAAAFHDCPRIPHSA